MDVFAAFWVTVAILFLGTALSLHATWRDQLCVHPVPATCPNCTDASE